MEAREHIERLRRQRGVGNSDCNSVAQILQSAIDVLANDLYTKPTHFLLELIQNADDNKYATTTPTISFYLESKTLLVSCNEVGFSPTDVDAICDVGKSTKTASRKVSGYIGEKGIGFKSGFKLADSIQISSGPYSFKFVKSHQLGMITPIWEDFPSEHLQKGFTQFLFEIPSPRDVQSVTKDLCNFQPSILIFLRRLRHINFKGESFHKEIYSSRSENPDLAGEAVIIRGISLDGIISEDYFVQRHKVGVLPGDPKRLGINESEVAIAFPLTACKSPLIRDCYTYNFLPIRQYGFSFLIQADFLLTANREDVDENPPWNLGLLDGVVQAFALAVHRFNLTNLKYSWPAYLQCLSSSIGVSLFETFRKKMVARLKTELILENRSGSFRRPAEVWYLRPIFMDDEGEYLLRSEDRQSQLLSSQYKIHEVSILDVRHLTFQSFLSDLKHFMHNTNEQFREKSHLWHSKLANVLRKERADLRHELRLCPIIPLQDGSWVTPANDNIFFASTQAGVFIPGGIDVLLVEKAAAQCQDRRQLYQILGVKTLDIIGVCKRILKTHENPSSWCCSTDDLVFHASYMFHVRDTFPMSPSARFWLVGANGKCAKGNNLYIELPNRARVSDFAMPDEDFISLIHPLYLEINSNLTEDWIGWLQNALRVAWLPRLLQDGSYTSVTPEFHSLMNCAPAQCLLLVRDHWDHYFPPGYHRNREREAATRAMRLNLQTRCSNGKFTAIGQSFLPRAHMTHIDGCRAILPFLDIPDPDNILWQNLSLLGVATDLDLEFYLQYLTGIQGGSFTAANAHDIYKRMTRLLPKDGAKLSDCKTRFSKWSLIFVARPSPRWLKVEDCFWKAPNCLRSAISISNRYPACAPLFKNTLGLRDATAVDIVNELIALRPDEIQTSHIKELLFWLSDYVSRDHDLSLGLLAKLERCAVFPVYQILHERKKTWFVTRDDYWFIADRPTLRRAFEARVPLLDLSLNEIDRLHHLFVQLQLHEWKLSSKVDETTEREGDYAFDEGFTVKLLEKLPFIERLLANAKDNTSMQKLKNLEVFGVTKVTLKLELGDIRGDSGDGDLVISESDTCFALYIKASDLQSGDVPYSALANCLSKILGIGDEHKRLVMDILVTQSQCRLETILEQCGFHSELYQDNDLDDKSNESDDDSMDTPHTIQANINVSYMCTEEILGALDDVSREDDSGISHSRISVTQAARSFDRDCIKIARSSMPFHVASGEGTVDHQTESASPELKCRPQSSQRVWNTEDLVLALPKPERDQKTKKISLKSPRYSRSDLLERAHARPRSEAIWEEDQETGYLGELFTYNFLRSNLPTSFGADCWTSNMRVKNGLPAFTGMESSYSDFTLLDTAKEFSTLVLDRDLHADCWAGNATTFHIEVKSTTGACNEPFYMSYNQQNMCRSWTLDRKEGIVSDVYLVFRVYNLKGDPGLHIYLDPWKMYLEGKLDFKPQGPFLVGFSE